MFVKVHKPLQLAGGNNKGSSYDLMEYLSKENQGLDREDIAYDGFFNAEENTMSETKAVEIIDGNNQRLSDGDTKFYMLSFNPSQDEQRHLVGMASGGRTQLISELAPGERLQFGQYLKDYTNDVMELYANSFSRKDKKGDIIEIAAKDLNYVAKVEEKREYTVWDKNVKHNLAIKKKIDRKLEQNETSTNPIRIALNNQAIHKLKGKYLRDNNGKVQTKSGNIIFQGTEKGGWNHHIHVVVSRQTKSKWYKGQKITDEKGNALISDQKTINRARGMQLSPNAKGTGKSDKHRLNEKKAYVGFHQEKFKTDSSALFNAKFDYRPKEHDQYRGKTYKNVSLNSQRIIDRLGKRPLNKAKGHVIKNVLGDAGRTERQLMQAVADPKTAALSELKKKIKEILSGKEMTG